MIMLEAEARSLYCWWDITGYVAYGSSGILVTNCPLISFCNFNKDYVMCWLTWSTFDLCITASLIRFLSFLV